jgi:hypothetical protein
LADFCLTTRWSGPGQLGAKMVSSLGRAAQLEAVVRPASWWYEGLPQTVTVVCP